MVNQALLIGIIVGVFFAGLGIGYVAFSANQPNFANMTPQQMMSNPQLMSQWHQTMMDNPQAFDSWMGMMMDNPQHMNRMMGTMMQNPQFGNWMIGPMRNDPDTFNNMMGPMMKDPKFMNRWIGTMMQDPDFQQKYMGPWVMMKDPQFMHHMSGQWFQGTDIERSAVQTSKVSILADTWQYQSTKAFSPPVIKVSPGTTVTWTNDDQIIHTVTDLGDKFDSGLIQAGEAWDHTFDAKGTNYYFCSIHPWMRGVVIVS